MPASETFEVLDGHLIRKAVPARGEPYEHRCPFESYKELAYTAQEAGDGFTVDELAEKARVPMTQAAVALAFWKDRGCVVTRYRRNYAADNWLFEDAMTEYYALAAEA
jgi:hypothetical protein